MKRWFRRMLRRYRIEVPFTAVICPEHLKTIRVGADWRTDVTVQRTLVFLEAPEPGDLRDVVPVDADMDVDSLIRESPDAQELARRRCRHGTVVYWKPREPIIPYALYVHQHSWSSSGSHAEAALYTQFRCDTRTGILALEITTPAIFETAVAFKRPRWRRMTTERSLVKYALTLLESQGERPAIVDNGCRLEWKIVRPKVGDRYVCVAFHQNGVAQWQKRLEATSIAGRMRRLMRPSVST